MDNLLQNSFNMSRGKSGSFRDISSKSKITGIWQDDSLDHSHKTHVKNPTPPPGPRSPRNLQRDIKIPRKSKTRAKKRSQLFLEQGAFSQTRVGLNL